MSTDVGDAAQTQPRDASILEGRSATEDEPKSSGFDVRQVCVGLTAAGWCAEVPRTTAFCWKHTH